MRGQSLTVPRAEPSHSPWGELETNRPGMRRTVCELDLEPDAEATVWVGGQDS